MINIFKCYQNGNATHMSCAAEEVFSNKYLLRHIFLYCDDWCRNVVYRVCKWWRENYKWVNPKRGYLKSVSYGNFKFARELFDVYGEYFSDNYIFIKSIHYRKLIPNTLAMLLREADFKHIDVTVGGNKALALACKYGHRTLVNELLKNPLVDPSEGNNICINLAAHKGHMSIVRRLLKDPRVDPSMHDNTIVIDASAAGHSTIVNLLLKDPRVNPSANENIAIKLASYNGYVAVVDMLLRDPRVDPCVDGNYCIKNAKTHGHECVMNSLIADARVYKAVKSDEKLLKFLGLTKWIGKRDIANFPAFKNDFMP